MQSITSFTHSAPGDEDEMFDIPRPVEVSRYVHGPDFDARLAWAGIYAITQVPSHWDQGSWRNDPDGPDAPDEGLTAVAREAGMSHCGTRFCYAGFISEIDLRALQPAVGHYHPIGSADKERLENAARTLAGRVVHVDRVVVNPPAKGDKSSFAATFSEFPLIKDAIENQINVLKDFEPALFAGMDVDEFSEKVLKRIRVLVKDTSITMDSAVTSISAFAAAAIGLKADQENDAFNGNNSIGNIIEVIVGSQVESIQGLGNYSIKEELKTALMRFWLQQVHQQISDTRDRLVLDYEEGKLSRASIRDIEGHTGEMLQDIEQHESELHGGHMFAVV